MDNLTLFREMTACIPHLYHWTYTPDGALTYSNCPDETIFHRLFCGCGFPERISEYSREQSAPFALGTYMGMIWYAVPEKEDGALRRIHLLGPALSASTTPSALEQFLKDYEKQGLQFHARHLIIKAMERLPVIFQTQFSQLALMLHYCVNGEQLTMNDVRFPVSRQLDETHHTAPALYRDIRFRTTELMESLRAGDVSILSGGDRFISLLPTNAAKIDRPLRRLKDSGVIFAAQCAQAAIDGGMTPENAYSLADRYIGSLEQDLSAMELTSLMRSMYRDFLTRVHESRLSQTQFSPEVRSCMDYVALHIEEDLSVPVLSETIGYSGYYLSRKFRQETGTPLKSYILQKRVEKGALLLSSTDESIEAIAARLQFCSRSHFSDCFSRMTGETPTGYRKRTRGA